MQMTKLKSKGIHELTLKIEGDREEIEQLWGELKERMHAAIDWSKTNF